MKKILLSLFLSFPLFAIYIDDTAKLDQHVTKAYQEEFNAVGLVYFGNGYGTGTLIHPKVVLTAAHVVEDQSDITFYLYIKNQGVKGVKGRAVIHPNYKPKSDLKKEEILTENIPYDVALLFLEESIDGIDYPSLSSSPPPAPADYLAVGYGKWNGELPENLLNRKLSGISFHPNYIEENLIILYCANFLDIDLFATARQGDSGGPLIRMENDKVIYGVLSCLFSDPSDINAPPFFVAYSSVHSYLDWLLTTLEKNL
jgi:hypothetical protein